MKIFLKLAFLAGFCLKLISHPFLLYNPDHLVVPKSQKFIQTLSSELYNKTGFSLYVVAVDRISGDKKSDRDLFKKTLQKDLVPPYGVIFFFKSDQKIDIVLNPKQSAIDPNQIITSYMVPILMQEKDLPSSKISASILNGYAQLADEIASFYGKTLENNLIVDRSGIQNYVHYLIYVLFAVMFGLIAIIFLTRKKQ